MAGIGPAPKPPSKRRRRTPPASYGAAEPIVAPAAGSQTRELGITDPHFLVERMWTALQESAEARFYSSADWVRVQWELWNANVVLASPGYSPTAWQQIQHGLTEMLISPAAKRRAAIELKPVGDDPDANAAVSMMGTYRSKLQSVKPE